VAKLYKMGRMISNNRMIQCRFLNSRFFHMTKPIFRHEPVRPQPQASKNLAVRPQHRQLCTIVKFMTSPRWENQNHIIFKYVCASLRTFSVGRQPHGSLPFDTADETRTKSVENHFFISLTTEGQLRQRQNIIDS
jgi:hypothetical protein